MPLRFLSNDCIRGFKHNTYSIMLRGHSWRTELLIGIWSDRNPLISISNVACSYSLLIFCRKHTLNPRASSTIYKYSCEILSKAALKSINSTHRDFRVFQLVLSRHALQPQLQKLIFRVHHNIGLGGSHLLKIASVLPRLSLSIFYNQCSLMSMVCSHQLWLDECV